MMMISDNSATARADVASFPPFAASWSMQACRTSVPTTSYPALTILKAMAEPIAPRPMTPTFFVMPALPAHREILSASCVRPLGSGAGMVAVQTRALTGAELASLVQHELLADVRFGQ